MSEREQFEPKSMLSPQCMTINRPWYVIALLAIGINLLLYVTFLNFASPRYGENDDWAMMSIASGACTGEPDEHLVFTNVIVGQGLKHLYLLWPSARWYTIYLLAVNFASTTFLLAAFLRTRLPLVGFLVFIALFCQFQFESLLLLQFTSTAAVAATSGMIALLAAARGRGGFPRIILSALGICLIVSAAMIRPSSFYLAILLGGMVLVYWFVRTRSRLLLVSLGCSLLLAVAAISYSRWVYSSDPDWSRYMGHLSSRGRIEISPANQCLSFPEEHWDEAEPVFEKIGWSKNDAIMYSKWFFADKTVYSQENLDTIVAAFGQHIRRFSAGTARIAQQGGRLLRFLAVLCLNGLAAVLICRRRPRFMVLTLLAVGLASAVLLGLLYQMKLPQRVSISILYTVSASLLFVALSEKRPDRDSTGQRPRHWISRSETAALCVLALLGAREIRSDFLYLNPENRAKQTAFQGIVNKASADILTLDQHPILVVWAGAFPVEWASVFSDGTTGLPCQGRVEFGWVTHSPHYNANLQKLSIRNISRAIYERQDVYLVTKLENMPLLVTFIKEHFGDEIAYRELFRYPLAPFANRTVSIIKAYRVDPAKAKRGSPVD